MRYTYGSFVLTPTNGDMSQATVTANATINGGGDVRYQQYTLIQAVFTGAPVGSLQLFLSADNVSFAAVGSAVSVSAAGNAVWDIVETGGGWAKVVYTKTSGTGTLTVNFSAKGTN